jgi:L-ascorbate metabolism protein UlaG (beta-lactamase superfamily)
MKKALLFLPLFMFFSAYTLFSQDIYESDIITTSEGDLKIMFIGHGSLMFAFKNHIIHVDPYSKAADYKTLPPADIILITHEHSDHLDAKALAPVKKTATKMIMTQLCFDKLKEGAVMKNGDTKTESGITIEAVPAYNIVNKRADGQAYHPKGSGNGYILTFGDKRIYIAGDTENVPEMKALKNIYCAFLPMNLPYTMTPEMTADAAKTLKPKILYPYHFGDTDTSKLVALLKSEKNIEVRIRKMQ